jgi:hypothetical protein
VRPEPQALLASGDAWQQMLGVLRVEGAEPDSFAQVYAEALRQLEGVAEDRVRWYDLMRIVLSWALWRRPRPERAELVTLAEQSQINVDRKKEVKRMAQTVAESIWE